MRRELIGDDAFFDISFIRQAKVFLWCHVAQHCSAVPTDHCRSDTGGDVVVTRRNVCSERPQCVERRFMALFQLQFHVLFDQVHGHVTGAFDHHLYIMFPCNLGEFT